jgi:uncharacterized membrane protein HdeD (DUF308 family)
MRDGYRDASAYWWLWLVAGIAWMIAALVILQFDRALVTIHPENTFAALADILGFVFMCVGVWWTIRAFLVSRSARPGGWTWSGAMMLALAFWTRGQFFIEKAYTLLVFAGIWALLHGITDAIAAFRLRDTR